ncbi:TEKT2 protein, partial [Amia calva]|nr:TEKT2 protein [Amia calva]
MATLSVKPGQRFSVPDWQTNSQLLSSTAENQRSISHQIRQEGRALRTETTNQTLWDQQDTCSRLYERAQDVARWKDALEASRKEVDTEIEALSEVKEDAERALAAMTVPLEVAVECLTLRDGRRGNELLRDPVEAELKKEVEVTEGTQQALQQKVSQAFAQLCIVKVPLCSLLQEAWQQLTFDLQNKAEALEVEQSCLSLTETSPHISLKPNPLRVPSGSTSPQQWEQFSQYSRSRAQEEVRAAARLRETMRISIAQVLNELEAQRVTTDFALRKQSHELERARGELLWQHKTTQEEVEELEQDIRRLEDDLRAKTGPLKLAHTRLEIRTTRPSVELCRDQVQYGLVDEVKQLEATIAVLKQKLAQSQ